MHLYRKQIIYVLINPQYLYEINRVHDFVELISTCATSSPSLHLPPWAGTEVAAEWGHPLMSPSAPPVPVPHLRVPCSWHQEGDPASAMARGRPPTPRLRVGLSAPVLPLD